ALCCWSCNYWPVIALVVRTGLRWLHQHRFGRSLSICHGMRTGSILALDIGPYTRPGLLRVERSGQGCRGSRVRHRSAHLREALTGADRRLTVIHIPIIYWASTAFFAMLAGD